MPEIFHWESMLLNTSGPRLKNCRGDEEVGIQVFASSLVLKTVDPGLKIAGVTKKRR